MCKHTFEHPNRKELVKLGEECLCLSDTWFVQNENYFSFLCCFLSRVAPLVQICRINGILSMAPLPPSKASMCKSAVVAKQQHMLKSVISLQTLGLIWAPCQMMEKNQHMVKGFGCAWAYISDSISLPLVQGHSSKPASEHCTRNTRQISKDDFTHPASLPGPSFGPL